MENKYLEEINGELVIKQDVLEKLKSLKEQKEKIESELKTFTNLIIEETRTHFSETTSVGSSYNFVVKGGTWSYVFDEEAFKLHYPELYILYLKPTYSKETYVLMNKERKSKNV